MLIFDSFVFFLITFDLSFLFSFYVLKHFYYSIKLKTNHFFHLVYSILISFIVSYLAFYKDIKYASEEVINFEDMDQLIHYDIINISFFVMSFFFSLIIFKLWSSYIYDLVIDYFQQNYELLLILFYLFIFFSLFFLFNIFLNYFYLII